jgi:hypothetical protein
MSNQPCTVGEMLHKWHENVQWMGVLVDLPVKKMDNDENPFFKSYHQNAGKTQP